MNPDELLKAPICSGIYYFRNKLNGKYYIGQADKLRKRLRHHVSNVKCNRYDNPIYRAIRKYGWEDFEWGILEMFEDETYENRKKKLDEAEEKYIKEFNSYGATGYNQTRGGDGGIKGYKFTPEQIKHRSEVTKNVQRLSERNTIYYYDIETKEYGEWFSLTDFCEIHNIKTRHLDVILLKEKYIVGRTKEQLDQKIKTYYDNCKNNKSGKYGNSGQFKTQLTEEMKADLINNMNYKEFMNKYSVCKKTYYNYKQEIGLDTKRVYTTKVNIDEYREYRKNHTRKETANYFKVTVDYTYDCDKRIKK